MLKEIFEQPRAIENTVRGRLDRERGDKPAMARATPPKPPKRNYAITMYLRQGLRERVLERLVLEVYACEALHVSVPANLALGNARR
jgi:glucosamine 6-phosphate synthetase-like amidotransferase/phosphosugar isomerase protein